MLILTKSKLLAHSPHTHSLTDSNTKPTQRYEILEAIGRGRFSQVHLCHLRGTKEDRAVKITDKKIMNEKERELLRTEISVLRLVKHPNLIRLYDVFETPDAIFLVMELVTGGELYEHIVGRARFTEFECYNVVKPLLTGVAYLHELGIVHRDLKPENILCGDEIGDLKIADFGLSKFVMPSEMLKMPCGTLTYVVFERKNILIISLKYFEYHTVLLTPHQCITHSHQCTLDTITNDVCLFTLPNIDEYYEMLSNTGTLHLKSYRTKDTTKKRIFTVSA